MVLLLWKAGNRNRPDEARIFYHQGEAAAIRAVLKGADMVAGFNIRPLFLQTASNIVRAVAQAVYYVDLPLYPLVVVRQRPFFVKVKCP